MSYKGKRIRLFIVLAVAAVLLVAVYAAWRNDVQGRQAENEMLETTEVLGTEMEAIWDFMELSQTQFKRHEDGTYNLYCVVAAKAVAKLFTVKSGEFEIHYTNVNTRKPEDAPDAFEAQALAVLLSEPERESYYGLVGQEGGSPVFRYIAPLYYKESCLECHGSPAGELDMMGYPKEGKQVGDLAGAASIIMPANTYLYNVQETVATETIVFAVLVFAGLAIIFWAVSSVDAAQMRRLEAENQFKNDFLAVVSHEMRTPLTSILAFSDIWVTSNTPRSVEEAMIMSEVRLHSQSLLAMVNNILELARIEAGRMKLVLEAVDVADLLQATNDQLKFLAQKRQVDLNFAAERGIPVLLLDYEKVLCILGNLGANAIKFVETGGFAEIRASYDRESEMLCLSVKDNGPGIVAEDIPYLFDRFVRGADSETSSEPKGGARVTGSGLGLALVKELAELHGGNVSVTSELDLGSTFTVEIRAEVLEMDHENTTG